MSWLNWLRIGKTISVAFVRPLGLKFRRPALRNFRFLARDCSEKPNDPQDREVVQLFFSVFSQAIEPEALGWGVKKLVLLPHSLAQFLFSLLTTDSVCFNDIGGFDGCAKQPNPILEG